MVYIIVKSGRSSGSKSAPKFHPHYNSALGGYYHTAKDYYGDMKKKGLEPYDPSTGEKSKPRPEMSKESVEVIKAIKQQSKNGKFKPSGQLVSKMVKMGALHTKKAIHEATKRANQLNSSSGGFTKEKV